MERFCQALATGVKTVGVLVFAAGIPAVFEHLDFTMLVIGYVIMRSALVGAGMQPIKRESRGLLRRMKSLLAYAATTFVLTAGLAVGGLGAAMGAQAAPGPFPGYHWCPGDFWDPAWGDNWEWGTCHDDHHRDIDGGDRSRDFWG